jgi:hypothetical protein
MAGVSRLEKQLASKKAIEHDVWAFLLLCDIREEMMVALYFEDSTKMGYAHFSSMPYSKRFAL